MQEKAIHKHKNHISISISGLGGSGVVTAGSVLLKGIGNSGFYAYLSRFAGPQIRGGESAITLNISNTPIESFADYSDFHFALDWRGFEQFSDEVPLSDKSCIIFENSKDTLPEILQDIGAEIIEVNLKEQIGKIKESRSNAFAIGILAGQIGLPLEAILKSVQQLWAKKGAEFINANYEAIKVGYALLSKKTSPLKNWTPNFQPRWNISGNEACGLGALRGGIKYVAAYPITPATDIVEYLSPRLEKVGGAVMIAEDELAAINMVIGGSFGGKPSMTATSGPGLSLMSEALGLAVASETPALVIDVMRGGPSTGLPTKSEQTDLNQALFGMHGEAPHIVLAPLHIADNVSITQWGVGLAEALQTLVIVLSDQRLGQSRAIIDAVPAKKYSLKRRLVEDAEPYEFYERYALTEKHVSPMAIPGNKDGLYVADGLEHTPTGKPSSAAFDHQQQLQKRQEKLTDFDYGDEWAEILQNAEASTAIVLTWGSVYTNAKEAVLDLNSKGYAIDIIAVRLLMPLESKTIETLCKNKKVIVVEQSYSGQFYHYCLGQGAIESTALSLAKPGPLVLKIDEIQTFIKEVLR